MPTKILTTSKNIEILFEDNHLLVINKRAGDIVQGDKTGDLPLNEIIKEFIKNRDQKPGNVYLGVVHRLDRPTTGVILFAKTSKALSRLNKAFANKHPQKTYWALVKNKPKLNTAELIHYLKRKPKQNKSYANTNEVPNSKKAILNYKLIKSLNSYHLLEINLQTGRHHQIRSQLSKIGCPIKGDLKYGFDRSNPDASIHLHARKIEFTHPVTKEKLSIIAPTPKQDSLWKACN
ncbi:RluA family pseudouridine synthase [Psychroflexus salis]|uniref:RNA pseudouridine synthase n=1 Tax=Psychroflexus salis TaxID=1526574 RepID=A0A916ZSD6_9FLAO|nr:RluA family pseudouridine synthase [Psychroflexus salis]GGE10226.1 RNA pseudouridine synthase [Psychroflexus salis]